MEKEGLEGERIGLVSDALEVFDEEPVPFLAFAKCFSHLDLLCDILHGKIAPLIAPAASWSGAPLIDSSTRFPSGHMIAWRTSCTGRSNSSTFRKGSSSSGRDAFIIRDFPFRRVVGQLADLLLFQAQHALGTWIAKVISPLVLARVIPMGLVSVI